MWVVRECCSAVTHSCLIISFFLLLTCPQVFLVQDAPFVKLKKYMYENWYIYLFRNLPFVVVEKILNRGGHPNWVLDKFSIQNFSFWNYPASKWDTLYTTTKGSWSVSGIVKKCLWCCLIIQFFFKKSKRGIGYLIKREHVSPISLHFVNFLNFIFQIHPRVKQIKKSRYTPAQVWVSYQDRPRRPQRPRPRGLARCLWPQKFPNLDSTQPPRRRLTQPQKEMITIDSKSEIG